MTVPSDPFAVSAIVHMLRQFVAGLDTSVVAEAMEKINTKGVMQRFKAYMEVVNQCVAQDTPLITGESQEDRNAQYLELVAETESLWDDCVLLFENGRYTRATALAITCIEEIGKIGVARFQLMGGNAVRDKTGSKKTQRHSHKSVLYSHPKKHLLAAGAGALINARLDRVLGETRMIEFLESIESNKISTLREAMLYANRSGDTLFLPSRRVTCTEARFYVALAGELLAEVLGFEPSQWERLLERVKQFERKAGLDPT